MNLYKDCSSHPKGNAQINLLGRTHYVDDASLRFHKSRILRTVVVYDGLLLGVVESVALDMNGTKRGFRPVVFNIFGTVISRTSLDETYMTRRAAETAMWKILNETDAKKHTIEAARARRDAYSREMADLIKTVREMGK